MRVSGHLQSLAKQCVLERNLDRFSTIPPSPRPTLSDCLQSVEKAIFLQKMRVLQKSPRQPPKFHWKEELQRIKRLIDEFDGPDASLSGMYNEAVFSISAMRQERLSAIQSLEATIGKAILLQSPIVLSEDVEPGSIAPSVPQCVAQHIAERYRVFESELKDVFAFSFNDFENVRQVEKAKAIAEILITESGNINFGIIEEILSSSFVDGRGDWTHRCLTLMSEQRLRWQEELDKVTLSESEGKKILVCTQLGINPIRLNVRSCKVVLLAALLCEEKTDTIDTAWSVKKHKEHPVATFEDYRSLSETKSLRRKFFEPLQAREKTDYFFFCPMMLSESLKTRLVIDREGKLTNGLHWFTCPNIVKACRAMGVESIRSYEARITLKLLEVEDLNWEKIIEVCAAQTDTHGMQEVGKYAFAMGINRFHLARQAALAGMAEATSESEVRKRTNECVMQAFNRIFNQVDPSQKETAEHVRNVFKKNLNRMTRYVYRSGPTYDLFERDLTDRSRLGAPIVGEAAFQELICKVIAKTTTYMQKLKDEDQKNSAADLINQMMHVVRAQDFTAHTYAILDLRPNFGINALERMTAVDTQAVHEAIEPINWRQPETMLLRILELVRDNPEGSLQLNADAQKSFIACNRNPEQWLNLNIKQKGLLASVQNCDPSFAENFLRALPEFLNTHGFSDEDNTRIYESIKGLDWRLLAFKNALQQSYLSVTKNKHAEERNRLTLAFDQMVFSLLPEETKRVILESAIRVKDGNWEEKTFCFYYNIRTQRIGYANIVDQGLEPIHPTATESLSAVQAL